MTSLLCANPVLIALELGLSPEASWTSYREVIDGFITATASRLPPDAQKLASSTSSATSTGPSRSNDKEWWLHALPHVLQSRRGICRIFVTAPTFLAQLLEVLLKESVRASQFGEACRRHFCFIVEGICCTGDLSSGELASIFAPLVTTAQVTMDYIDGAHRALAIAACLVFSGIASPSVLLPAIRRRLQEIGKSEETLTADVASMLCVALHDGLTGLIRREEQSHPNSDVSSHEPLDSGRPSAWTTLKKRDSTPRISSRSPRLGTSLSESREGSPSGDFVLIAKDPILSIPFPDKPPTNITVPSAVVMSCMILSSTTLTVQPALRLGQWCLQALHTLPLTITACALTQLVIKFPKAFRVSSSQDKSMRFCDAVIIHCCRIVGTLFERRLQHGVHGSLTNASTGVRDDTDEAVNSIDVMPCFLLLCLQAIQCSSGLLLSADAQHQLGKLFVHSSRLYVSHHSFAEEESAKAKALAQSQPSERHRGESSEPHRLRNTPNEVVSQVFRATLRAVDMVLHDYEAGTPETLRQVIIQTAPPHGALTNRIQEYGGCVKHQDLMETILAVCNPQLDERLRAHDGGAPTKAGSSASSRFSLIGWLPCSSEPLVFAGFPYSSDGGMTARQKGWVMKRMVDYFRREWFLARVGVQTAQMARFYLDGDGSASSASEGGARETFFDCFPRMSV